MIYTTLLTFLHLLFVVLFVGSGAALSGHMESHPQRNP